MPHQPTSDEPVSPYNILCYDNALLHGSRPESKCINLSFSKLVVIVYFKRDRIQSNLIGRTNATRFMGASLTTASSELDYHRDISSNRHDDWSARFEHYLAHR